MAVWIQLRERGHVCGTGLVVLCLGLAGCTKSPEPAAADSVVEEEPEEDDGLDGGPTDGHEGSQIGWCGNGVDDDGDGLVDCDDPDCLGAPDCEVIDAEPNPDPEDTGFETWDPRDLQYKFVSAGLAHTCGMDFGGNVHCWGDNTHGQTDAVEGTYTAISAGGAHTCAASTLGPLVCWGKGFDDEEDEEDGTIAVPEGDFWDVSSSGTGACAISVDSSTPVCFGIEVDGETMVARDDHVVYDLSLGWNHACAIDDDGTVYCWGENDEGQMDPPEDGAHYVGIGSGGKHTCAIKDGGVPVCWGSDEWGQSTPPPDISLVNITAGYGHTCGITHEGHLVCWGGEDPEAGGATPPEGTFYRSSAGGHHSCAVTEGGELHCWGNLSWNTSVPQ